MRSLVAGLALTAAFAAGCASAPVDDAATSDSHLETAAGDSADTSCKIILRSANRRSGTQGPVDIEGGQFVWDVTVDLANELAEQDLSAKLHLQNDDGTWRDLASAPVWGGAPAGFERYQFSFRDLSPESSSIDVGGAVTMIAFAQLPNGRLFDHNGNADNVVLSRANGFRVTTDTCK